MGSMPFVFLKLIIMDEVSAGILSQEAAILTFIQDLREMFRKAHWADEDWARYVGLNHFSAFFTGTSLT